MDATGGSWTATNVVVATGDADLPRVPSSARLLAGEVCQLTAASYKNPRQLPAGGVLGASASGVQIAEELRLDGREVVLAVGRHNRLPRRHRGRDVLWWLDRTGALDRTVAELPEPTTARCEPSLQLAGRTNGADLDLDALQRLGVRLAGRLVGIDGTRVRFAADLRRSVGEADARMVRVLARIDRWAATHVEGRLAAAEPPRRVPVAGPGPAELDLRAAGITSIVWATGYRRDYSWLHAPAFDLAGEIHHHRGRTPVPGLYALGLRFQTRRRSTTMGHRASAGGVQTASR